MTNTVGEITTARVLEAQAGPELSTEPKSMMAVPVSQVAASMMSTQGSSRNGGVTGRHEIKI